MLSLHFFLLFNIILNCGFSSTLMTPNSLSGRHLRVIWVLTQNFNMLFYIRMKLTINIWLISVTIFSHVGVAIPKDFGDHSREESSSIFYLLVSISRDDEKANIVFQFTFFFKQGLLLIFYRYEMVRVTENRLEPQGTERGLFNYLWDQVEY